MTTIEKRNGDVTIDRAAVLRSLNLNPSDPKTQTLLLVCEKYGLDPILKHMVLIQGNAYVTRDGYLAIAHRSGVFDGMEVLEQSSDSTHYIAKVAVHRKDMKKPFTFVGRFPKTKHMAKDYGPEMAVKVAEVQALRRAFNVTGVGAADERWDAEAQQTTEAPKNVDTETGEVRQLTQRRPSPLSRQSTSQRAEIAVGGSTSKGDKSLEADTSTTPTPHDEADIIQNNPELMASIDRGLAQSAAGETKPWKSKKPPLSNEVNQSQDKGQSSQKTVTKDAHVPAPMLDAITKAAERKNLGAAELSALIEEHSNGTDVKDIQLINEVNAVLDAIKAWGE